MFRWKLHKSLHKSYIRTKYSTIAIYTRMSRSASAESFLNGVRMFSGPKNKGCPYAVTITMQTAFFLLQGRTSEDRKSMDKVLILRSRCLLCTRESNMDSFQLQPKKEQEGFLLCSQTVACTGPRLLGRVQCQNCANAWNAKALEREMNGTKRAQFTLHIKAAEFHDIRISCLHT